TRIVKGAFGTAFEEPQATAIGAQQIRRAVTVEIRNDGGSDRVERVAAQPFLLITIAVSPPEKTIATGQNDFRETIAIQIINNQRIDIGRAASRYDRFVQDQSKSRLTFSRSNLQMTDVDALNSRRFSRRFCQPIDDQIT